MRQFLPAVLGAALAAISGCGQDFGGIPVLSGLRNSDEAQIAAVLADVHRGMESRRIYKVLSHVSRTYMDAEGRDYDALDKYLNELFRKYGEIHIERADPRIIVEGDRAHVQEAFGTRAEPQLGSSATPVNITGQVTVHLIRVENEWKIKEWGVLN